MALPSPVRVVPLMPAGIFAGAPLSVAGVGADVASVSRIARLLLSSRGERFADKVLHPVERAQWKAMQIKQRKNEQNHSQKRQQYALGSSPAVHPSMCLSNRNSESSGGAATEITAVQFVASRWALKEAAFKAISSALARQTVRRQSAITTRREGGSVSDELGDDVYCEETKKYVLPFPQMRLSDDDGPKRLVAEQRVAQALEDLSVLEAHASVSHDSGYAMAIVVLSCAETA